MHFHSCVTRHAVARFDFHLTSEANRLHAGLKSIHMRLAQLHIMVFAMLLTAGANITNAHPSNEPADAADHNHISAPCSPATSQAVLDVNNVRARLLGGGDMWWDLAGNPGYEVPKVQPGSGQPSVHSLFAGALWIGGIDAGGQLKLAAQTYRSSGNDFWPGPLDDGGLTDDATCHAFDRHWKINRLDIEEHRSLAAEYDVYAGGTIPVQLIPKAILEWPAAGNPYAKGNRNILLRLSLAKPMAPFVDVDGKPGYDPTRGDYPSILGDQSIWWVYNDRGDAHGETRGAAIGLEVQMMAFAFATGDVLNDMTFYRYTIRNYSTSRLDSVFFGQWVDGDLGYGLDDFVGCDPERNLGIIYNGDAFDEGVRGYGSRLPLLGIDLLQGPSRLIATDPCVYEPLGMTHFMTYQNSFTISGNPEIAPHYYSYMTGAWKDGSPWTFGGYGYNTGDPTTYFYPHDPHLPKPAWSECSEQHTPYDRNLLMSSGPFQLLPGAFNELFVGVVWVRQESQTGCMADFDLLRSADDIAQTLFDNAWAKPSGPDAPDITIRELDREIIVSLSNRNQSNNFNEAYAEVDPVICVIVSDTNLATNGDCSYRFQGYKIFQLRDANVSTSEFSNPDKARLIAQCDLKDDVAKLVNIEYDLNLGAEVPVLMVDGENKGIRHTFQVTEDAFATGDKKLVNFKTYYFSVVAYAANNYLPFDPSNLRSQKRPYLQGRGNVRVYSAIPHKSDPLHGGTMLHAVFGDGPDIKRIEGEGNGGNAVDLTSETIEVILSDGSIMHPIYRGGAAPVNVKVYDPLRVPIADFELAFSDTAGSTNEKLSASSAWTLVNLTTGERWNADRTIGIANEQLIPEIGLAITIGQTGYPGPNDQPDDNGFIEATIEYADPALRWLSSVPDAEGVTFLNWIRSGSFDYDPNPDPTINPPEYDDARESGTIGRFIDSLEHFENVLDGTWAPFRLIGGLTDGNIVPYMPMRPINVLPNVSRIDSTVSIDLVLTSDKWKWTRCAVIEMSEDANVAEGGRSKLQLRAHSSLNLDGSYNSGEQGRSWFPGYAINVETGQRLNIVFSEDSWLVADRGNDMIWNPTDNFISFAGPTGIDVRYGGKHFIYVSNTPYDEGAWIHERLSRSDFQPIPTDLREVYRTFVWASMAMVAQGYKLLSLEEGLIPTETKIRLRIHMPYRKKAITGENQGINKYWFSTRGLAPLTGDSEMAKSALDLIRVVPNPYYAYSAYEKSPSDHRVKIINLPSACTVKIYALDGTMVRRFTREITDDVSLGTSTDNDNIDTSIEWDLKNDKHMPVASGSYIIHVAAPGVGEKVVKWFGVMRPLDAGTF